MNVTVAEDGDVTVVRCQGKLEKQTSVEFERQAVALVEGGVRKLVLDVAELEYVSSAGLRVLLTLAKKLKAAQGKFVLCRLTSQVSEVFEISGFSGFLPVTATVEEAVRSCA